MKNLDILYEDEYVLAINKPAGVLVHPDSTGEISISDLFQKEYPDSADVGEPARLPNGKNVPRPGIVHRLDKETSGVLLIAKTKEAYESLKSQFQNKEVEKVYKVFVHGEIKEPKGVIERPIGRSSSDFRKWSAQRGARGELREAVTKFKTIHAEKIFSYLEVRPQTGRTHQIRVHLKAINHPVVGDSLYAPNHSGILGFKRLALHAKEIIFKKMNGEPVSVVAPYPKDFLEALVSGNIAE